VQRNDSQAKIELLDLPAEVLFYLLLYTDPVSLSRLSQVSRILYSFLQDVGFFLYHPQAKNKQQRRFIRNASSSFEALKSISEFNDKFKEKYSRFFDTNGNIDFTRQDSDLRCYTELVLRDGQSIDAVKKQLDRNKDVIRQGLTFLHLAVRYGHFQAVKYLVETGHFINFKSLSGATPLLFAVEADEMDIVKLLLKHKADSSLALTADSNNHGPLGIYRGDYPLHAAVKLGKIKIVQALIEAGADINARNAIGATPLLLAVAKDHVEVAKCLLQNGADLYLAITHLTENSELKKGDNAFIAAIKRGYKKMLAALFKDPDQSIYAEDIESPLHCAVIEGKIESVQTLIELGADVNLPTKAGNTLLQLAKRKGFNEIAEKLIESGASLNEVKKKAVNAKPPMSVKSSHSILSFFGSFARIEKGEDAVEMRRALFSAKMF
jgi:ankyrin repeat protein